MIAAVSIVRSRMLVYTASVAAELAARLEAVAQRRGLASSRAPTSRRHVSWPERNPSAWATDSPWRTRTSAWSGCSSSQLAATRAPSGADSARTADCQRWPARHPLRRARQALRRRRGARPPRPRGARGPGGRLPRAERRREVHDDPHPARPRPSERRPGRGARCRSADGRAHAAPPHRLRARRAAARRAPDRRADAPLVVAPARRRAWTPPSSTSCASAAPRSRPRHARAVVGQPAQGRSGRRVHGAARSC